MLYNGKNKALLPIILKDIKTAPLREIVIATKILTSYNYSYGYKRGEYGTLTDTKNKVSYRIGQQSFETLIKEIDSLNK